MGESKPGDVGDSKGTFHDRARKNSNVIVDGEVKSQESNQRSNSDNNTTHSPSQSKSHSTSSESVSQAEVEGKVVTVTADSTGGTQDSLGWYKNHQVHIDGGTPGEKIKVKLESGPGYLIGRRVTARE